MVYNLYCIYDRISGQFGSPTPHVNEASAQRWFLHCVNSNEFAEPTDFELYCVGEFNINSGKLVGCEPQFILKGKVIEYGKTSQE